MLHLCSLWWIQWSRSPLWKKKKRAQQLQLSWGSGWGHSGVSSGYYQPTEAWCDALGLRRKKRGEISRNEGGGGEGKHSINVSEDGYMKNKVVSNEL